MKRADKVFVTVMAVFLFFVSGGVACTYSAVEGVNLVLVAVLGILVFVASGYAACTIGARKIAKRKAGQI